MLLIVEQTNELLLKNHDLRSTGAKAILEANANENKNNSRFRCRRRESRYGSQRGSDRPLHHNNKPSKRMHFPQIKLKARNLCRNMIMLAPVVV